MQVALRPWMKPAVDFPEAVAGDVGVDFGGADVRVAEEFLDDAQIRAVLQEVRGETVSQHVGGNVALDPGVFDAVLDMQP